MIPQTNMIEYSTQEKIVGKWINGKPIYRKVIQNISSTSITDFTDLGTINNFGTLVKLTGYFCKDNSAWYPLNYGNVSESFIIRVRNNNVQERHNYDYASNCPLVIIVEYTKTTD